MIYRFAQFELDEDARELRRAGEKTVVQPRVFELLALLVRHHRRVVSKDELLDTVWPDRIVTEASIQRAVSLARSALGAEGHRLIQTFRGYGYRFRGKVRPRRPPDRAPPRWSDGDAEPVPRIQHTRARDGVRIAFYKTGSGPPLVYVPNLIWSHGLLEWRSPEIRRWYLRLAARATLVRFDPRGTGSSQRDVEVYSLGAIQRDIEAVVEALGLDRFSLFADLNGGPVAIRYAAAHPESVSHLVLWHSFARTGDIEGPRMTMIESLQPLMDQDWETYTETRAHMGVGWADGEAAHRYAAMMRECASPELARRSYAAGRRDDVTALLSRVRAPTLVLHRRQFYFWGVGVSRKLAARIDGARLVMLEGAESAPFLGDCDAVAAVVNRFLDDSPHGT